MDRNGAEFLFNERNLHTAMIIGNMLRRSFFYINITSFILKKELNILDNFKRMRSDIYVTRNMVRTKYIRMNLKFVQFDWDFKSASKELRQAAYFA
jgi:hypothetical protein